MAATGAECLDLVLEAWSACRPEGVSVDASHLGRTYSYLETQLGDGFLSREAFLREMQAGSRSLPRTVGGGSGKAGGSKTGSGRRGANGSGESSGSVGASGSTSSTTGGGHSKGDGAKSSNDADKGGEDLQTANPDQDQHDPTTSTSPGRRNDGSSSARSSSSSSSAETATESSDEEQPKRIPFFLFWRGLGTVLLKSGHWEQQRRDTRSNGKRTEVDSSITGSKEVSTNRPEDSSSTKGILPSGSATISCSSKQETTGTSAASSSTTSGSASSSAASSARSAASSDSPSGSSSSSGPGPVPGAGGATTTSSSQRSSAADEAPSSDGASSARTATSSTLAPSPSKVAASTHQQGGSSSSSSSSSSPKDTATTICSSSSPARTATTTQKDPAASRSPGPPRQLPCCQSLFLELEILRERILHKHGREITFSSLESEIDHAVGIASSQTRDFWVDIQRGLRTSLYLSSVAEDPADFVAGTGDNSSVVAVRSGGVGASSEGAASSSSSSSSCTTGAAAAASSSSGGASSTSSSGPRKGTGKAVVHEEQLTILTLAWLNEAAHYARERDSIIRQVQEIADAFVKEDHNHPQEELRDPREFERRGERSQNFQPGKNVVDLKGGGQIGGNQASSSSGGGLFAGIMRAVEQVPASDIEPGGNKRSRHDRKEATSKTASSNTNMGGKNNSPAPEDDDVNRQLFKPPSRSAAQMPTVQEFYSVTDTTAREISHDPYAQNTEFPYPPPPTDEGSGDEGAPKEKRVITQLPRDGEDITDALWFVDPGSLNGLPVFIHVYDVSQENSIKRLNRFTAHKKSPLKFGGIFHAGVEINGLEWSYGATFSETACGVACNEPKQHPQHRYRQSIYLGLSKCSNENVAELLGHAVENWPGDDYDLLRRNCCHFADEFCLSLGVGPIPGWIHRFARIGSTLDSMYTALSNFGRKCYGGRGEDGGSERSLENEELLETSSDLSRSILPDPAGPSGFSDTIPVASFVGERGSAPRRTRELSAAERRMLEEDERLARKLAAETDQAYRAQHFRTTSSSAGNGTGGYNNNKNGAIAYLPTHGSPGGDRSSTRGLLTPSAQSMGPARPPPVTYHNNLNHVGGGSGNRTSL
ncbi:unnamed protein product [Amoebophrya sp. A25]|nr:unnamed protein product [Amoebophrya sp. A25]|eukprot:GSA25T00002842001.1